ncbi:T9SS type B sorting domain-containing protein [Croceitalea sp. P059]|uniref:T9SS type B sorting domain-containing protein n=1 Tax=Croceitalea sp. P059 TaxID=3075601 RepID=UPI002887AE34|nr:T9SS type B sorting domain-containing protein [Croceitalea sp. P059]MDT0540075.1 T9SS type B sorting domain-containing protein [Croceitalea sp. P059]
MKGFVILFFLLVVTKGFAQKEAANWYFGKSAGLDFNSGQPLPLIDGVLNSVEGSAAISDVDGNLLFYTDGITIWNRNHDIMPNGEGIKGSSSSSQAAVIMPNPVQTNLYYVFTTDDVLLGDTGEFNGFNFSVVDMNLDNGLGDVVEKNNELLVQSSEKVSAIKNERENNYWVITHFTDRFYAFRVDENGVNNNPVVSAIGPSINNYRNGRGALKFSPNGNKLAMSYSITTPDYASSLFLFDFDIETGIVSNPIEALNQEKVYYGLEFSSNSKKLYASGVNILRGNMLGAINISQFDLEAPDIFSSEKIILTFENEAGFFLGGSMQIGIDKRIYHAIPSLQLSVIKNPNADSQFIESSKFETELSNREASFGLPTFVQSYFETIFEIENFCLSDNTTFTPEDISGIAAISWDFGDPNSGASNYSNDLVGEHIFSNIGYFTITVEVTYDNGATRQFIEYVNIQEIPDVLGRVSLVQCDIDGVDDGLTSFNLLESIPLFNNGNDELKALFFETEENANLNENIINAVGYRNSSINQTIFARVFKDSECFVVVEIDLIAQPMSDLGLYDTFYICDGRLTQNTSIADISNVFDQLSNDFANSDILLFESANDALLKLNVLPLSEFSFDALFTPELYFRIEEDTNCAFIGSVQLVITETPDYEISKTAYLCEGVAEVIAPEGYESYLWSTGLMNQKVQFDTPGIYDVLFSTGTCSYAQTVEILPEIGIVVEAISIQDFSRNNQVQIQLGINEIVENTTFSLDGGQSFQNDNTFNAVLPGVYDLVVYNGCSVYEEEIIVGGTPSFFTPNNDGVNDVWTMANSNFFPDYKISIFDRYGTLMKSFQEGQIGWDGRYQNKNMPADDYWYYLELQDGRSFKGFFALKR